MVTASQVNELRQMTGSGMMDCKKALVEANGDINTAVDILRKKGAAKAAAKADRKMPEGRVFLKKEGKKGALVLLGCETDFVAKNEKFQAFGNDLVNRTLKNGIDQTKTEAESEITELVNKIGENMALIDIKVLEADTLGSYIHTNGKIGVLVGIKGGSEEVATDVAMHTAAMNPSVLSPNDVDDSIIAKEKEIWADQLKDKGKPANIIDNIMIGKEKKFRGEIALKTQIFVKDSSKTVETYVKEKGGEIISFVRLAI